MRVAHEPGAPRLRLWLRLRLPMGTAAAAAAAAAATSRSTSTTSAAATEDEQKLRLQPRAHAEVAARDDDAAQPVAPHEPPEAGAEHPAKVAVDSRSKVVDAAARA